MTEKKKRGRPSLYSEDMCDDLIDQMANGALDYEVFAKWDISKDTFYRWINEYPEFKEAYERGLPKCEAWWSEWGRKGMKGEIKGFSFNAWIAFMNNKFKWAKQALADGNNGTTVNINTMNVLQQKTPEELIKQITKQLNDLDIIDLNETQYTLSEPTKQNTSGTSPDSDNSRSFD